MRSKGTQFNKNDCKNKSLKVSDVFIYFYQLKKRNLSLPRNNYYSVSGHRRGCSGIGRDCCCELHKDALSYILNKQKRSIGITYLYFYPTTLTLNSIILYSL